LGEVLSAHTTERKVHTVVVGASAGGIEALRQFVGALPRDFPGVVLVVLHISPLGTSVLPQILARAGALPASHPADGEQLEPGHIYIAPPDRHLLVEDGHVRLGSGPKRNGHRPAIDLLFETAAHVHGRGVAGVVLSGLLDDGTAGLIAIKRHGGLALAQDPEEALYTMMPRSAIEFAAPDLIATAAELGLALAAMAEAPPPAAHPPTEPVPPYVEVDRGASNSPQPGTSSGLTCPECNGGMWEVDEAGVSRYRCRVGHEYTETSFVASQADRVEAALWTALRALEERAAVHRRLAERHRHRGLEHFGVRYQRRAEEAVGHGVVLRELIETFSRADEGAA
jgi:two-component system, chemotaxis family, protein-glutamate methylesterase/glutaminase